MSSSSKMLRADPRLETLEDRTAPSISSFTWTPSTRTLTAWCNNNPSNISITTSGSNYRLTDSTNGAVVNFSGNASRVQVVGGAANDRIVQYVPSLRLEAWGGAGNDYLEGFNAADYFVGGAGNDKIVGYGGNDILFGQAGNDVLLGMVGNDQLIGGDQNDHLNGGAGADKLWGGNQNDVLVAIDEGTSDFVQGDAGNDIAWVDRVGSFVDGIAGSTSSDVNQYVWYFANGADRTLDGDRLADPSADYSYKIFSGRPLFSSYGPRGTDVDQGKDGDCWLMAALSAIAMDHPHAIRENIVDFHDGTYGVRLGDNFYRVDNDLPVRTNSNTPVYAGLGAEGSMWVAIMEKAYAFHRTIYDSYSSLNGGWSIEALRAFRAPSPGEQSIASYGNATALANSLYSRWLNYENVTVGFSGGRITTGAPLVNNHMYTVWSFRRNTAGQITSIVLRNPWGTDGAGNDGSDDGFVTVTPAQLFGCTGRVNWGRV